MDSASPATDTIIEQVFTDYDFSSPDQSFGSGCQFESCTFNASSWSGAKWSEGAFINCTFLNCNLASAEFSGTRFDQCRFNFLMRKHPVAKENPLVRDVSEDREGERRFRWHDDRVCKVLEGNAASHLSWQQNSTGCGFDCRR